MNSQLLSIVIVFFLKFVTYVTYCINSGTKTLDYIGKPVNESSGQWTFLSMVRGHERSAARFRPGPSAVPHIR